MDQLKLPVMYTCHLIKIYYRLYRNKLTAYLEIAIRCEYEKMNAKFQMHYRLREFANLSRLPLYPTVHIDMDGYTISISY